MNTNLHAIGHTAHSTVRRSIEQALAAHPAGLPLRFTVEETRRREMAAGRPSPHPDMVVLALGMMVVQGRVDERDGRLVLCVDDGQLAA